jgi:HD superfamily phosphohydrolase
VVLLDINDLERRIRDIAHTAVGEDNFALDEGLRQFNRRLPGHHLSKKSRMQQFIEMYDEIMGENTRNVLFVPQSLVPSWPLAKNDIACLDYFNFFWHGIEDSCYEHIPGAPIPDILPRRSIDSLNYIIHGKVYHEFMGTQEFTRLGSVRQLGTIAHAFVYFFLHQTREDHSLRTALINDLVLTRIKASEHDIILGIVAGLYHDIATPPFSDQGKLAARTELDEEYLADLILSRSERMQSLFRKYGISKDVVVDAIHGEGLVGKLMNSKGIDTDKIAYVSRDFDLASNMTHLGFVRALYNDCPHIFHLFKDISVIDGEVVYSDPHKAMRFLQLRALMFSEVYMNPYNRAREAFLERELSLLWGKELKCREIFNLEFMMTYGDSMFENVLSQESDTLSKIFLHTLFNHFTEVKRVYDLTQFDALNGYYATDHYVVRRNTGFNPATSTLVVHNGEVIPLREVYPEQCRFVERLADRLNYIGVYHMSDKPLSPNTKSFYRQFDRHAGKLLLSIRQNI